MTRNTSLLGDIVTRIADAGRGLMSAPPARDIGDLCADLLTGKGEATGIAVARAVFDRYRTLTPDQRSAFFADMRDRYGANEPALAAALARYEAEGPSAIRALHTASEPQSQDLIRRLNRAPGGTGKLVAMRRDLLDLMAQDAAFRELDADFRHLFASWFNRGFLELRRIDWMTSAAILEKIIAYEAVHEITGWDDLRRRVAAPDRRLYGFFHPALRDDPLIFVEVALTAETPGAIAPILADRRDPLDPAEATTAVFYSISNCQEGLRGISFGHFLIKQVVEELQREFRALTTFVTLSPVPGLRRWARAEAEAGRLRTAHADAVARLEDGTPDPAAVEIAAQYLIEARAPRGGAADPVARFHLGNGARLAAIHAGADLSARGREGSWGVMVNYHYDLGTIERNHEAYTNADEVIASGAVRRLLKTR